MLEAEMTQIEAMMESLAQRRTMLRRRINALSPTSQLPQEILTEIFRLASHSSEDGPRSTTPLFFGGICKEWRDIAWSTPLLWNSVSLHVSRRTHGSQVHLLRDWLLRANSSPLYIKLTTDDEHESIFCSLRAIMDVLVARSAFWYSLDCLLPPQCHEVLKSNQFPMLTSVSIRPPKGTISTFSEPPNMFLSAPKLLNVDLSGYNFPAMVLPWEQLQRFKTQFLTVGECLKVLRRSPNLKECHLESVYSPDLLSSPTMNPLHSELEYLEVTLIKGAAISLLDSITLPSLCDLHIVYSGPGGFLLSAISSLVLRSSCNLQRLHIEKQNFHDDDLIPCLDAMSSLSHLHLTVLADGIHPSMGLTTKLVTMLQPSHQSGPPLLPNLHTFEYRGRILCDGHSLVSMLSERFHAKQADASKLECPPVVRLTAARIISPAAFDLSDELQSELLKLSEAGMEVNIRSTDGTPSSRF
ncbi:hypothetical protein GALMADRAFT_281210 [Galerina marginata CBS 339.88]|uniref:Uncharacterized protein n=1 Tax=Galerina marginata (strain CBS 339.88) TaxID=685588 RepID=A0A067SQ70_GALM3|nr:hypothetical protein GALMADRAFT_281210 [Galerina marginata CBS 339.88]